MKKLRDLEEAAIRTESGDLHEKRRLTDLIAACSSLGGARPKANVTDENGDIWIAKFPSVNDDHNIGAWEMVAHELAVRCGIHVPEARLMNLSSYGSTFLIRRFDRKKDRRIHRFI
ncbi:HipA-like N-terminal domain-containing protein [Lachnospiraceae bacterium XBB2008]|nr:HipA-like N-terminal domain-containing protein [Lachnospiraceae bacterium XBB2008]